MVSHYLWGLHVGCLVSILPLISFRLAAVLLLSADLEGKDWFYLGCGSIFGANALMGYFVAVATIWWLIVGCRYEIAWLIVDGVGGSRSIIFCGYFLVFCCHKWHRLIALCKNRVRFLWLSAYRQLKSATKRVLSYTMVWLLWGGARNAT